MTTAEFFRKLLDKGSINTLLEEYPALTYEEVNKHFQQVFEKFSDSLPEDSAYELYSDGASKGNPGHAGIGFAIKKENYVIEEKSEYIGTATNNVAEYTAFLKGLERLKELDIKNVRAFSDSELMVKQMTGVYSIKDRKLKELSLKAVQIIKSFDSFTLKHIPRDKNKLADKLSKQGSLNHST